MNFNVKKITALILAGALAIGSSGCSEIKDTVKTLQESKDSTKNWFYSDIEGRLTADMKIREQDDFHASVNKDWLMNHKPDKDGICIDLLSGEKEMKKQMRILIRDPESTGYLNNNSVGMSVEEISHAAELVARFAKEAEDTDKRSDLGAEPLRPYIESITAISSISEMSDFIADSKMNIPGSPMITITVDATKTDPESYRVLVKPIHDSVLTLGDCINYNWISEDAIFAKQKKSEITRVVLRKLGFNESEINTILTRCYHLECRLAENMQKKGVVNSDDYEEKFCKELNIADADALMGDYPFGRYVKANGLDVTGKVTIYQPDYMKALSDIYTGNNLEEVKAFYLVNTVYAGCDLLDTETAGQINYILTRGNDADASSGDDSSTGDNAESPDSAAPMDMGSGTELTEEDKATDALINNYIKQYLSAPFDMMYIAAFLSGEEKDALKELTHVVKAELRNILSTEEWMSDESRKNCVDKLDNMAERILFPDDYISYLDLDFSQDENLVDMARSILAHDRGRRAQLIGKPRTRNEWDLVECPTTIANAFNNLTANAIIIPSGITAGGFTYDMTAPYELNLARMGTILGHEMTHGFDDNGTKYDKYGIELSPLRRNDLMTATDRASFSSKTYHLSAWYTAQSPAPGLDSYSANISGEAIADMGGMKCALLAGSHVKDFDYDLFFRSYAELWRKICTEKVERLYATSDPHPLAFLRTNVTVQQFDEFMDTYDVKEGDGMYITPEERILIW